MVTIEKEELVIRPRFRPGDKAWVTYGKSAECLTVGMVRVTLKDSKGINNGRIEKGYNIQFDNYKPQYKYTEEYMMEETGIGSGSVFTLGINVFSSRSEAVKAIENQG